MKTMTAIIIDQTTLTKVDARSNNCKMWKATLFDDNSVKREWGRIGQKLQSTEDTYSNAQAAYNAYQGFIQKKMSERYQPSIQEAATTTFNTSNLPSSLQAKFNRIAQLAEPIQQHTLISWNPATGSFTSPIGPIGRASCQRARTLLASMNPYNASFNQQVEQYLQVIPVPVGRRLDPATLLGTPGKRQVQSNVIQNLEGCLQLISELKSEIQQALSTQQSWIAQSRADWVQWGGEEDDTPIDTGAIGRASSIEW